MIGLHNVANAVAKDKMKEPPASQIVLEPPKWFRKTPKANEGHVVEYYKDLKWDSDSEMLAMDSDSGSDTEEEEEEEPDEPKEKKVSAAAYPNPHLSFILKCRKGNAFKNMSGRCSSAYGMQNTRTTKTPL